MTNDEKERAFLIGLAKLTRETGMVIGGCGCCSSPHLQALPESEAIDPEAGYGYGYASEVVWISPDDTYDWEEYGGSIVRDLPEVKDE